MPPSQIKTYPDWGLALGHLIARKFFDGPRCELPSFFSRDQVPEGIMFFADILIRLQTQHELANLDEIFSGIELSYGKSTHTGSPSKAFAQEAPLRVSEFFERKWFASALLQESDYRLAITKAIDAVVIGPVATRQAAYAFSSGALNELISEMQNEVARDLFLRASDFSNGAMSEIEGSLPVLTRITETDDASPTDTLSEEQNGAVNSTLVSIRNAAEALGSAVSIHGLSFREISDALLEFIDETLESVQADFGMQALCSLVEDLNRRFESIRKSIRDNRDKLLAAHLPQKYKEIVSSGLLEALCHSVRDSGEKSRLTFEALSRTQQADLFGWVTETDSISGEALSAAVKKYRTDFDKAKRAFESRFGCHPIDYAVKYPRD